MCTLPWWIISVCLICLCHEGFYGLVWHRLFLVYTLTMVIPKSVIYHYRTYTIYFSLASLFYVAHFLLQFYLFGTLVTILTPHTLVMVRVDKKSSDGNPKICNLSLLDICDILFTNFVVLRCTFTIAILSFLYTGDHTDAAYSSCGLTNDLYRFQNISLSKKVRWSIISPRFLLANLILLAICSVNFRALSTVTPKSFSLSTFVMIVDSLFSWYILDLNHDFKMEVFKLFCHICHVLEQFTTELMFAWNCSVSSCDVTMWHIFASSANSLIEA